MKTCTNCHKKKTMSKENFYVSNLNKGGLEHTCKSCRSEGNRKWLKEKGSEYKSWKGSKARCYNKASPNYKYYGGRGIKVSDDWLNSYDNFIRDMGYKPTDTHSLDRIDNDGNYTKENCRWATPFEQAQNKRSRSFDNKRRVGVDFKENTQKWVARITVNHKQHYLGSYVNLIDAIYARRQAELRYKN